MKKLENYMFDFLGLVLPGVMLIVLIVVTTEFYGIDFLRENQIISEWGSNGVLANGIRNEKLTIVLSVVLILFFYVIGNVIKVFSKVAYDVLAVVFDGVIVKFFIGVTKMALKVLLSIVCIALIPFGKKFEENTKAIIIKFLYSRKLRNDFRRDKLKQINGVGRFFVETFIRIYDFAILYLEKIFIFKPLDNYDFTGKHKESVTKLFNELYLQDAKFNWYDIYKLSNLLLVHEELDTLVNKFMSKYNMYRSLSFIFIVNIGYLRYLELLYPQIQGTMLLYIIYFLAWFAFHEKYKRYWTLAGNEALMNAYILLLNKQKSVSEGVS